jgi:hypothetical protein
MTVSTWVSYNKSEAALKDSIEAQVSEVSNGAINQLTSWLDVVRFDLEKIVQIPEVNGALDPDEARRFNQGSIPVKCSPMKKGNQNILTISVLPTLRGRLLQGQYQSP